MKYKHLKSIHDVSFLLLEFAWLPKWSSDYVILFHMLHISVFCCCVTYMPNKYRRMYVYLHVCTYIYVYLCVDMGMHLIYAQMNMYVFGYG